MAIDISVGVTFTINSLFIYRVSRSGKPGAVWLKLVLKPRFAVKWRRTPKGKMDAGNIRRNAGSGIRKTRERGGKTARKIGNPKIGKAKRTLWPL